jgi:tRNA-specific 2-thiouridylase
VQAANVLLWPGDDEKSCCSPGALQRARASAGELGVPFYTVDQKTEFARVVVDGFVAAYIAGETPNPCVECNPLRLARLVEFADQIGVTWVATGHYARIVWRDGEPYVGRAHDRAKDQSYMLWKVPPETLARLQFPLAELTKPEVRERAAAAQLPVAGQSESQEVCFAPRGYRGLLAAHGVSSTEGAIVTTSGDVLGDHDGHWMFTVGQRRGLGLAGQAAWYVIERRPECNEVVVGKRDELARSIVFVRELVDRGLEGGSGLAVQLRYKTQAIAVSRLERLGGDRLRVTLAKPFDGPAPGQSAVFYRDDVVVGGGIVAGSAALTEAASSV